MKTSIVLSLALAAVSVSAAPQFGKGRQGQQGQAAKGAAAKGANNAGTGAAAATANNATASANTGAAATANNATAAAATANNATAAAASSGAATQAGSLSTTNVNTAATADNSDAQNSLTLDPKVIATGFQNNGQDVAEAGQVASLTSANNFINFCLTQGNLPITNGQQITTGSCNPAPIGTIPSVQNMPSSKFANPKNGDTIAANQEFTISMNVNNLDTGNFVNAQENYFAAPQQLNAQGQIVGHTHVVIESLTDLAQTTPTDPQKFAFFKGVNTAAVGGAVTADVTSGVPAGAYRLCSINSSSNHQPVIVPIAQHGSLDDCVYFTASDGGAAAASNATAATGAAAAGAANSTAAAAGTGNAKGNGKGNANNAGAAAAASTDTAAAAAAAASTDTAAAAAAATSAATAATGTGKNAGAATANKGAANAGAATAQKGAANAAAGKAAGAQAGAQPAKATKQGRRALNREAF